MTFKNQTLLVPHNPQWSVLFDQEKKEIEKKLAGAALDIQHIGSTAIPTIQAKPIIDIAVMIPSLADADRCIEPLQKLGYIYDKPHSSSERYFFRKGEPTQFHLSLTDATVGYWKRQVLFRDYLRDHDTDAKEYERLKLKLAQQDPTGTDLYISGKSNFITDILVLAKQEMVQG